LNLLLETDAMAVVTDGPSQITAVRTPLPGTQLPVVKYRVVVYEASVSTVISSVVS